MGFIETFTAERSNIFTVHLLEKIGSWLARKSARNIQIAWATLAIFALFEILQVISAIIFDGGLDIYSFINSILISFLGASSIFAVESSRAFSLNQIGSALKHNPLDTDYDKYLGKWFQGLVKWQWPGYFAFIFLGQSGLWIMYFTTGMPFRFHAGNYVILSLLMGCLSQGAYWASMAPLITREFTKVEIFKINLDPVFPHKSQAVIGWSNVLSRFSLWCAYGMTVFVICFFLAKPNLRGSGFFASLAVPCAGYLLTAYIFLYPQFNLSRLVQARKKQTLVEIQQSMSEIYLQLDELKKEGFERLEHLAALHKLVNEGQGNAIDASALRSLATSVLLPTITAFIGNAQNLSPGKFSTLLQAARDLFK